MRLSLPIREHNMYLHFFKDQIGFIERFMNCLNRKMLPMHLCFLRSSILSSVHLRFSEYGFYICFTYLYKSISFWGYFKYLHIVFEFHFIIVYYITRHGNTIDFYVLTLHPTALINSFI